MDAWKKCNSCKKDIAHGATYWICNVSTCNRKRTGLVFCTVSCWDAHLPLMNHRESWAEERVAPTLEEAQAAASAPATPRRRAASDTEAVEPAVSKNPTPPPAKVILRRGAPKGD